MLSRQALLLLFFHISSSIAPDPAGWLLSSTFNAPHVGMKCAGDFPTGFEFLLDPNNNPFVDSATQPASTPYYQNLIQLCAHQDWGGRRYSVGVRCSALTEDRFTVLIDYRGRAIGSFIYDEGLALYCSNKCWCTGGSSGSIPILDRVPLTLPTYLQHFRVNPQTYPKPNSISLLDEQDIEAGDRFLTLISLFDVYPVQPRYQAVKRRFTGDRSGRVQCNGPVAIFPIPTPDGAFYDTLLELCAASIYGGNERGSFGGACLTTRAGIREYSIESRLVSGGAVGSILMLSFGTYCHTRCQCDPADEGIDPTHRTKAAGNGILTTNGNLWEFRGARGEVVGMRTLPLGSNRVRIVEDRKRLRDHKGDHPAEQERVYTVLVDPDLSEPPQSRSEGQDQQQCPLDQSCKTSMDCNGCACHVNPSTSTVDPVTRKVVFHDGLCATLIPAALAMYAGLLATKKTGRLSGRGVIDDEEGGKDGDKDGDGADQIDMSPPCACNASYVSVGCCGTGDGIIWEVPELHLGVLA
jgi:hypothetical protein